MPQITSGFHREKPQSAKRSFLVGSLDCETVPAKEGDSALDGVVNFVTSHHELWEKPCSYRTMGEFLDHILFMDKKTLKKTRWYSHNGEYDWRYLINYFEDYKDVYDLVPIERSHGKFFQINVVYKKTTDKLYKKGETVTKFYDSFALYNQPLSKFTKAFAPDYEKGNIGLKEGVLFDPNNPKHVEYALRDAEGLVHAIINYDATMYRHFHVHIKGTFSSTAFAAMQRFLPNDEWHNRLAPTVEAFMRECYYGGRVQLNARQDMPMQGISVFDINSSYPASMKQGVPKGRALGTLKYVEGKPGFYTVIAHVPQSLVFPPIPHKHERTGQLSFPTGSFKTHISTLEIEYGKTLGITFDVIKGYVFEEGIHYPFNDFIDMCERLRAEYKGTPTEIVVKYNQNSVYGKFGTKPEGREVLLSFDDSPEGFSPMFSEDDGKLIPFAYYKDVKREAGCMLPHYAAWITAHSRLLLDRAGRLAGGENWFYSDTDSLHVNKEGAERLLASDWCGKKYGQFKLEKELPIVRYGGPKVYIWRENDGKYKGVCKGIPQALLDDQKILKRLFNGEQIEVSYHSSASMQTYLKNGQKYYIRIRKSTDPHHVYSHIIEDGKWKPKRMNL